MGLPIEFYVYVGYGLFAMIVVYVGMNFFLGGLLKPFMRVKRSRGKKVLVRIRNPVQDYFCDGKIEEGVLIFSDRAKVIRRIPMQPRVVSRAAGVFWVEIDDEKNCFFARESGAAVATYDAARVDSYIVRALVRPGLFGDNTVKVLLFLVVVLLIAVIAVGFLTYKNGTAVQALAAAVQAAKAATTGVVV